MANDCIRYPGAKDRDGYGRVARTIGGRFRVFRAHRWAWEQVHGPIPKGQLVLHRCDNPACINLAHLFLGTHGENMADRNAKKRQARGERGGRAKLTEAQVREIRRLVKDGTVSMRRVALALGMDPTSIRHLVNGTNWKHVR